MRPRLLLLAALLAASAALPAPAHGTHADDDCSAPATPDPGCTDAIRSPAGQARAYRVAGHSWWTTFRKIAIPLAKPGIAAAGLLAFIFAWNNFVFALILASADKQPVTVGALAFVTASGIQYGQIAAAIVLSVMPTLLLALYAQRYLVEGLSLGAVKG